MKVLYSDDCLRHNPAYETLSGKQVLYLESPKRYDIIREALSESVVTAQPIFEIVPALSRLDVNKHILAVHGADYIDYIRDSYSAWINEGGDESGVVPDTFPHPKLIQFKKDIDITQLTIIAKAGLYCFDLSTPITLDTYDAALAAVNVTLSSCEILLSEAPGQSKSPFGVFALTRPPGHHAAHSLSGGYCYFNNVAIAAKFLRSSSSLSNPNPRIAILDIDYHHGNGTQDIFYEDPSVFYVSLHAAPDYPYFTGTTSEIGSGEGEGFNLNIPLPKGTTGDVEYLSALARAIEKVRAYSGEYLVVSLGVDTYQHDPICEFRITTQGYKLIGAAIAGVGKPTLFVMEGGYYLPDLGKNVRAVLEGFAMAKME